MNPWYNAKLERIRKLSREDFSEPACDICALFIGVFFMSDEYVLCEKCLDKEFPEDSDA